ncbi:MAG: hypothetical protein IT198_02440 [Acidimicrobiia bacterium]|nr:hypothetical protein [Acidimicrobiia bacterium]
MGLHHVVGLGEAELASIARARAERPFTSLEDFVHRTEVPRPAVENLVRVGAFDSLAPRGRRALLWRIEEIWRAGGSRAEVGSGVEPLPLRSRTEGIPLVGLRDFTPAEKVRMELEILGLDVTDHLLRFYAEVCECLEVIAAAELCRHEDGARVTVAGVKVATQTPAVRSGKRIIFLTLDDPTGPSDITLFPNVQARRRRTGRAETEAPPDDRNFATIAFHSFVLAARGRLRRTGPTGRGISIVAEELWDLQRFAPRDTACGGRHPPAQRFEDLPSPRRVWHVSGGSAG